jgi:hypothetical protein
VGVVGDSSRVETARDYLSSAHEVASGVFKYGYNPMASQFLLVLTHAGSDQPFPHDTQGKPCMCIFTFLCFAGNSGHSPIKNDMYVCVPNVTGF